MTAPLEFHGVSVAYEGSDRPALSQVDLLVDEGEFGRRISDGSLQALLDCLLATRPSS